MCAAQRGADADADRPKPLQRYPPLIAPTLPGNEPQRLAAVHAIGAVDTALEAQLSRFVRLAKAIVDVPVAAVALIDEDRQVFRGCAGQWIRESPRELSFCAHAIHESALLQVPDASLDPRFVDNPLVTQAPGIRFYAGFPLCLWDGLAVGALCLIDFQPRELSDAQKTHLRDLADSLQRELTLHVLLRDLANLQHSAARVAADVTA
ncbi:GAF domain-containing protein [Lysobacter korlensis]|uniref:GAF domain-containing protein n=1 Tax=Lysobacter korlensis TaxID=553636 RepID=A0ABV6RIF2_9GAMM